MARAIKQARELKPFVRVRGFLWYEVKSSTSDEIYIIHFYKKGKRRFGECNYKAAEWGLICY
jgi:hypothetical protein